MTEPTGQQPYDASQPTPYESAPPPPAYQAPGYQAPAAPGYPTPAGPGYQQPGYQAPGYQQAAYYQQPYQAGPATNQKALLSMIFGIVGLTLVPILASIAAVVLGHMSRKEIERTGEGGRGMSTAGLVMGYIGSVGYLVLIVAFFVFFAALFASGEITTY